MKRFVYADNAATTPVSTNSLKRNATLLYRKITATLPVYMQWVVKQKKRWKKLREDVANLFRCASR